LLNPLLNFEELKLVLIVKGLLYYGLSKFIVASDKDLLLAHMTSELYGSSMHTKMEESMLIVQQG